MGIPLALASSMRPGRREESLRQRASRGPDTAFRDRDPHSDGAKGSEDGADSTSYSVPDTLFLAVEYSL